MPAVPLLLIFLSLLFLSGPFFWLLRPHRSIVFGWLAMLPPAATAFWLAMQVSAVNQGEILTAAVAWAPELGMDLVLRLDGLSLFFGLIITFIGAGVALYTAYYLADDPRQGYFYLLLFAFMGSMLGLVWADNLLTLFVFWELTSITSYLMVGYNDRSPASQDGARRALLVTGGGGLAMLAGMILLGQTAGTYTLSEILVTPNLTDAAYFPAALILLLIGAFTKSAQFPFHFWLPGAMAAPTPASAYLHSATMVKAGIYLLARLHPALSDSDLWFWSLLIIGGITMLWGAILAIGKWDLKALLAYATVSQLGILVMLLAFHSEAAYIGVVVGIAGHALYKGALFMTAGIVDHSTHTRDIRSLANLRQSLPWTTAAATLAALSMAGLPPLFGFLSKEWLLETLYHHVEHEHNALWWIPYGLAGLAGAFFVAYSLTYIWEPFFRAKPTGEPVHDVHRPPFGMVVPPLTLAMLGLVSGFVLAPVVDPLLSAPATAIAGEKISIHLAFWHGLTTVFMTSMVVIGVGVLLFFGRAQLRRVLVPGPNAIDGAKIFNKLMYGGYDVARWTTRVIQGGTLATQASTILLVAVAAVLYAMSQLGWGAQLLINWDDIPQFYEVAAAVLAILSAIATVRAANRLTAIIGLGVVGVAVTLFFVFFSAPDLALTQLLIEVLTVVLLILVFYKIPPQSLPPMPPIRNLRNVLVSLAVGLLGFVLVLVNGSSPFANPISNYFSLNSVPAAHGGNIVNVILVDFRGFDTMGEITVLAVAALGGYALLRASRLRLVGRDLEKTSGDD